MLLGFGTFSKAIEDIEDDLESKHVQEVMGISGFGRKAKQFDINEMVQKARKNAPKPIEKEPEIIENNSDDELIGPLPTLAASEPATSSTSRVQKKKKKKKETTESDESDDDDDEEDDDEEASDDDDHEEDSVEYKIPASHEVEMIHGSKAVTALSADASGARLASGSIDYELNFWDFSGMDKSMRSFRKIQPCENHPIRCLQYSVTGQYRHQ